MKDLEDRIREEQQKLTMKRMPGTIFLSLSVLVVYQIINSQCVVRSWENLTRTLLLVMAPWIGKAICVSQIVW